MRRTSSKNNYSSNLVCPNCLNISPIPRRKSQRREPLHIKDFWCYSCKCITKHIEMKEWELLDKEEIIKEILEESAI